MGNRYQISTDDWLLPLANKTHEDTETVVIVGCGKDKLDRPAMAKDMYTSAFFGLKRKYAEAVGDSWLIVSALYDVIHPYAVIGPYNKELKTADAHKRGCFQASLCGFFKPEWFHQPGGHGSAKLWKPNAVRFLVIAGANYRKFLSGTAIGPLIINPVEGLGLFDQMTWLKENTRTAKTVKRTIYERVN